ncbi:MAG: hypothetical protein N3G21_07290 [Candidatus Hydrogenedentes bacterium]|nr:hypothetical protein [Candidatus Hydrogenedentota bacterium]
MKNFRKLVFLLSVVSLFLGTYFLPGCGRPVEQTPPKEELKELRLPEPNGNVSTTPLLKLTPSEVQISVVLPSLAEGLDKLVALAKRFYNEDEVNSWVQARIIEISSFAGVPEAKNLIEVAEARGFDISIPLGIYLNLSPSIESLLSMLSAQGGEGEGTQAGVVAKSIDEIDLTDITQPNWAVAIGVKDKNKVVESLKELVVEIPEISASAPKEEVVKGAQVVSYGPYAYSVTAGYVVIGSASTVKGIVSCFSEPLQVRYGTPEMPALDVSEGVIMLKDWELIPMVEKLMPHIIKPYPATVGLQLKLSPWSDIAVSGEKDPVYICFSLLPNERLIIRSLLDSSKKPKYVELVGNAQPISLLKILPPSTQASAFFQLTKEYRTYLEQNVLPDVKNNLTEKREIAQGMQYATSFMRMFGNELGVGITGSIGDFPAVIVLIKAGENAEMLKGFLDTMVPVAEEPEKHREVEIKKVALPSPVPVNLAMVKDVVVVSNNADIIKGTIDLVLDGGSSDYLKGLTPPVDAEIPRYTFVSLQSKLFLDVIFPLMSILGKDLGGAQRDVESVLKQIRELRIMSEKRDGLVEGQIIFYFTPEAN